VYCNILRH